MHTLNNGVIECSVDDRGNLVRLRNLATGRDWAGNGGLWRIIYQHGHVLEEELCADSSDSVEIRREGERLSIRYAALGFTVVVTAYLEGEQLFLDAELANGSAELILREFQFPMVTNATVSSRTALLWSRMGGEKFDDVTARLAKAHTQYMGQDNKAQELAALYPGSCGANCFFLGEPENTLGLMSCDPEFRNTLHLLRKRKEEIDVVMVKYPFLPPGGKMAIPGYRISVTGGSWHRGADLYRQWCDTWMRIPEKPESIRKLNGWHRLIMRHQYGKQLYHYRDLPKILKSGKEAGFDTLFMFGWHAGGHDSCYPEYVCAEDEGGFETLREEILRFQDTGGHVNLYFNGQLIDMGTRYYEETGKKLSVKLPSGREHMEVYPFGGDGTALRQFGNKVFVTACPACREWWDELKKMVDTAIALGCDGVFFDQLGYLSRPCCDPSHGHGIPFMDVFKVKSEMVAELRRYIKSRKPEMSFGIEWFNDVTAQHVDYIHNISGGAGEGSDLFLEFCRYLFPETVLSDREIRDDRDIEYRVNHALRLGYVSDVEIYRCRALIDETPHYKAYLTKADAFRDRNRELVLNGRFRDTVGAECDNPMAEYAVFEAGERIGVIVCSPRSSGIEAEITVPGAGFIRADTVEEGAELVTGQGKRAVVKLPASSLILLEYQRLT